MFYLACSKHPKLRALLDVYYVVLIITMLKHQNRENNRDKLLSRFMIDNVILC